MRYSFDAFSLDTDRFELGREGTPIHLEPQALELLVLLVENCGRMVSKDEIIDKVWRGSSPRSAPPNVTSWSSRARLDDARHTGEQLLREMPRFSCRFAREKLFYLREQDQVECYLEGLRLAGIPQA